MNVAVSTIQSLIGQYPLSLFSAHPWYVDYPTNLNPLFDGAGRFASGDLPFGLAYEVHNLPATTAHDWTQSLVFERPLGHLVTNAALLTGIGSDLPVEEFFFNRPRGLHLFREPSTTSLIFEMYGGPQVKLWGLYIDIPLITPAQMTFTPASPLPTIAPPTYDGTVFAGLNGIGTLSIARGVIGARVDVTTLPSELGLTAGDPDYNFDVGWVNWSDGTSFRQRERITNTAFATFPTSPAGVNQLNYTLAPGVVVTVTELWPTLGDFI